jgi:hypothetical protein
MLLAMISRTLPASSTVLSSNAFILASSIKSTQFLEKILFLNMSGSLVVCRTDRVVANSSRGKSPPGS